MVIKFSEAQFEAFEREGAREWDIETAHALQEIYPDYITALGVGQNQLEAFCHLVRDYGLAYQITAKREVFRLIVIAMSLGAHFPHDPRFRKGIEGSLARLPIPQDRRITLMADLTAVWLNSTWDGSGTGKLGLHLVDIVQHCQAIGTSRDGIRQALSGLVLQNPIIAIPETRQEFLDACVSHADGYGLSEPQRRLAYVGCALLHGVYWFDDPLLVHLRKAIEGAVDTDNLCDRMASFYEGFS